LAAVRRYVDELVARAEALLSRLARIGQLPPGKHRHQGISGDDTYKTRCVPHLPLVWDGWSLNGEAVGT
jgi:hypothetical protein